MNTLLLPLILSDGDSIFLLENTAEKTEVIPAVSFEKSQSEHLSKAQSSSSSSGSAYTEPLIGQELDESDAKSKDSKSALSVDFSTSFSTFSRFQISCRNFSLDLEAVTNRLRQKEALVTLQRRRKVRFDFDVFILFAYHIHYLVLLVFSFRFDRFATKH